MIWEGRRRVKEVASHWPHVRPWIYRIQNLGLCYQANQSSISTLGWNTQTVCTSDWILVSISEECVLKSQRVRSIPHILLGLNCMSSSCSLKPCTHSSQPKITSCHRTARTWWQAQSCCSIGKNIYMRLIITVCQDHQSSNFCCHYSRQCSPCTQLLIMHQTL